MNTYTYKKRWRDKNREATNEMKKRNYHISTKYAVNNKMPWTKEEEKLILEHSMTDRQLAQKLGRSVQAIQVRRSKLKAGTI